MYETSPYEQFCWDKKSSITGISYILTVMCIYSITGTSMDNMLVTVLSVITAVLKNRCHTVISVL